MSHNFFQRRLLPGFLFQSVLIGGGYATGRELVEFFLTYGPREGLWGIILVTLMLSLVAAVFFEFARVTCSSTYIEFFKQLLGKFWFLYEVGYILLGVLVLSVIAAAAGEISKESFAINDILGTMILCIAIAGLVFFGTRLIEKVLVGWSLLLYGVYAIFIVLYLIYFGSELDAVLSIRSSNTGWYIGGLKYVGYSIVVLPVIVFVVKHLDSRRDAVTAGLLAGPIAMLPALLFYLAMAVSYEDVLSVAVPADYMINKLNIAWLSLLFYITIFGTFIETGTAFIHAFNERIAATVKGQGYHLSRMQRSLIALFCLTISMFLAQTLGVVGLIAQGYGILTWFFIVIFLLPLMTVGVWRVKTNRT